MATRIAHGTRHVPGAPFGAAVFLRAAVASLFCLALLIQPAIAVGGGGGNGNAGNNGNGNGGSNAGGNGNAGGNSNAGSGNSNAGGNGKSNAGGNGVGRGAVNDATSEVDDPNAALGLREAGRIHPLADAYSAAERQFGGEVIGATLALHGSKTWTYDLRLVTQDGRVRTLSYDATTLALLTVDGAPAE